MKIIPPNPNLSANSKHSSQCCSVYIKPVYPHRALMDFSTGSKSHLCGVRDSGTFLSNNVQETQKIKNTYDYGIKTKLHIFLYPFLPPFHFTSPENKNNSSSKYITLGSSYLGSNKWQRSHAPTQLVRFQGSQPWLHFKITSWGVCACSCACTCAHACVCVFISVCVCVLIPLPKSHLHRFWHELAYVEV